jgi:hypothetical protein
MARKTRADASDAISRLADSGGKVMVSLVTLPLRVFVGALDALEIQVHKAADGLRDIDPLDERVVELEKRLESLEEQTASRRQSSRATAARQATPAAGSSESSETGGPERGAGHDERAD